MKMYSTKIILSYFSFKIINRDQSFILGCYVYKKNPHMRYLDYLIIYLNTCNYVNLYFLYTNFIYLNSSLKNFIYTIL